MYVIQIPTNKPVIREDFGDLLFATKKGKYKAVIKFKGNKNYKASSKKVKITIK